MTFDLLPYSQKKPCRNIALCLRTILLSLLVFFSFPQSISSQIVEGQDIYVFNRDIDDGLSQNIVISLAKDSFGMIWIGTLDGINSFDGQHFEELAQYHSIKGPSNDYYEILAAPQQAIYTKRDDGIHKFDFHTKIWTQNSVHREAVAFCRNTENQIVFYTRKDELYIDSLEVTQRQASKCNYGEYLRNPKLKQHPQTGDYYLLSVDGILVKYDRKLQCEKYIDLKSKFGDFLNFAFVEDQIWVVAQGAPIQKVSLDLQNLSSFSKLFEDYPANQFTDIHVNENQVIICADRNGIYTYDLLTKVWQHRMVRMLDNPQGEHEYIIRAISDGERVYFGSTSNGLLIYDPRQINFHKIPEVDIYNSTIFDLKLPRKIVEDINNEIWISTTGQGLWKYSPLTNSTLHYTNESNPSFLRSNSIRQVKTKGHHMWIGYNGLGVDLVNLRTLKVVQSFSLEVEGFSSKVAINDFYIDEQDDLWIATEMQGVFILDKKFNLVHFHTENSDLRHNDIYNIKKINGQLILASFAGDTHLGIEESNTVEFLETPLSKYRLSVKCFESDLDGNIWLGTGGQGIIKVDKDWVPIDTFSIASGDLLSNELCIIIRDKEGNMWAGSNKGLVLFKNIDKNYYNVRTYLQKDGLQSNEFMTGAYLRDSKNKIWMGGINGVNVWDSEIAQNSPEKLDIYIREFEADDSKIMNVFQGNSLGQYPKRTSNFNVSFSTLGFCAIDNIQYKLKLEGFDDKWRELGNRNFQEFSKLPAGDYTLKIKSTNYDGVWNNEEYNWPFSIDQTIWDKWWFYAILLSLLVLLILYMGRRYSLFKVKKEQERANKEKDRILMEMNSLRSQINPHFLFNTLSSINNFIVNNEKNIASQYLVKFSRLIRTILNHNTRKLINLEEEIKALTLYIEIEQMRLGDSFDYFINLNIKGPLSVYSIPPLILQPVVENAIWHGLTPKEGNQILSIDISEADDFLIIKIADNGIGRIKSAERERPEKDRSYGMEITSKRLLLWLEQNGIEKKDFIKIKDLLTEDNTANGTEVEIYIPKISISRLEEKI